jgi:hypothetical protein
MPRAHIELALANAEVYAKNTLADLDRVKSAVNASAALARRRAHHRAAACLWTAAALSLRNTKHDGVDGAEVRPGSAGRTGMKRKPGTRPERRGKTGTAAPKSRGCRACGMKLDG